MKKTTSNESLHYELNTYIKVEMNQIHKTKLKINENVLSTKIES